MRTIISLAILACFLFGCQSSDLYTDLEPEDFKSSKSDLTLAFDLRNERSLKAGVIIKNTGIENNYLLNLPVEAIKVRNNKSLLSTNGLYDDKTILTFYMSKSLPDLSSITFLPNIASATEEEMFRGAYGEMVYLIKRGLTRHFIYNYEKAKQIDSGNLLKLNNYIEFDAIAVALPEKSRGIEIGKTKKTTSPDPIETNNIAYFFPSKPKQGDRLLELKYQLDESTAQELIQDGLSKWFLAIFPVLAALFLLQKDEINNPRFRKFGLIIGLLIEAIILFGIIFYSFYYQDPQSRKSLVDISAVVCAAIFSIFLFITKKSKEQ